MSYHAIKSYECRRAGGNGRIEIVSAANEHEAADRFCRRVAWLTDFLPIEVRQVGHETWSTFEARMQPVVTP